MAVAIQARGSDASNDGAADCQRSERVVAAAKTSQHAKTETLLLCSSGTSLVRKLF